MRTPNNNIDVKAEICFQYILSYLSTGVEATKRKQTAFQMESIGIFNALNYGLYVEMYSEEESISLFLTSISKYYNNTMREIKERDVSSEY